MLPVASAGVSGDAWRRPPCGAVQPLGATRDPQLWRGIDESIDACSQPLSRRLRIPAACRVWWIVFIVPHLPSD